MRKSAVNTDNVVQFKKTLDETHLNNAIEATKTAIQARSTLADDIAELGVESLLGLFTTCGIILDSSRIDPRDLIHVENAIKGLLYRYYRIEHPIHEVTEEVFRFEGLEEDEEEE